MWKVVILKRDSSSMYLEGNSVAELLSRVGDLLGVPFDDVLRMSFVHVLEDAPVARGRELAGVVLHAQPP